MSLLDQIRDRYGPPAKNFHNLESGTAKTAESPSDSSGSTSPRDSKVFGVVLDMETARRAARDREDRRARVLADLEVNPELRYAWLQTTAEDGSTILTVAIRDTGSAELFVEPGRFDPFEFIRITSTAFSNTEKST